MGLGKGLVLASSLALLFDACLGGAGGLSIVSAVKDGSHWKAEIDISGPIQKQALECDFDFTSADGLSYVISDFVLLSDLAARSTTRATCTGNTVTSSPTGSPVFKLVAAAEAVRQSDEPAGCLATPSCTRYVDFSPSGWNEDFVP